MWAVRMLGPLLGPPQKLGKTKSVDFEVPKVGHSVTQKLF